jgi:hypothetical protein
MMLITHCNWNHSGVGASVAEERRGVGRGGASGTRRLEAPVAEEEPVAATVEESGVRSGAGGRATASGPRRLGVPVAEEDPVAAAGGCGGVEGPHGGQGPCGGVGDEASQGVGGGGASRGGRRLWSRSRGSARGQVKASRSRAGGGGRRPTGACERGRVTEDGDAPTGGALCEMLVQ